MRFPAPFASLVAKMCGLVCVLLCLLGSLRAAPLLVGAAFTTAVESDSGVERVRVIGAVLPNSDPMLGAALQIVLNQIEPGLPLPEFQARVQTKLRETYRNATVPLPTAPGASRKWLVSAAPIKPVAQRLAVRVYTSVLPPPTALSGYLALYARPVPLRQLAQEQGLDLPIAPAPDGILATLIANASVELVGTNPQAPCPAQPSPALKETLDRMLALAGRAALITATEYGKSQIDYRISAGSEIQTAWDATGLSSAYQISMVWEPAGSAGGTTLTVALHGLNPAAGIAVHFSSIDLPNGDGQPLTFLDLRQKYKGTGFAEKLIADAHAYREVVREKARGVWPEKDFPRFYSTEERADRLHRLFSQLKNVSRLELQPKSSPPTDEKNSTLVLDATYQPNVTEITGSLTGDSVREAEGQLSFTRKKLWKRLDSLNAGISAGADVFSAHGDYQLPYAFGGLNHDQISGQATTGVSYTLTRNVRLGNRTGPLTTLTETRGGPAATFRHTWVTAALTTAGTADPASLSAELTLSLDGRSLRGDAPPGFLGPVTSRQGLLATDRFALEYDVGRWSIGTVVESTRCFVTKGTSYTTTRGTGFARYALGPRTAETGFIQLKGYAARQGDSSPRIDFLRLGGDDGLAGMTSGELAGRSVHLLSLEGGPTLQTVLDWLPIRRPKPAATATSTAPQTEEEKQADAQAAQLKAALRSTYLYVFYERGQVGRQAQAGTDFNPAHRATSYGIGAKLMGGVIPGLPAGGSVSLGYGWSPQAIRRSGRFFVSAFFLFGP